MSNKNKGKEVIKIRSHKRFRIKRYLTVYRECVKVAFASASTYRLNFLLNCTIMLLQDIIFPLITVLIYGSGAGFNGWTVYEVFANSINLYDVYGNSGYDLSWGYVGNYGHGQKRQYGNGINFAD